MVLISALAAGSDRWDSFDAASVKTFGCSIDEVDMHVTGDPRALTQWSFTAWAKRDLPAPMDDWRMALGYFPPNAKGRASAMRECQKWMTEAEKRIKTAQKGTRVERKDHLSN